MNSLFSCPFYQCQSSHYGKTPSGRMMKQMNQARARYYVLYLHDGNYLYHVAEDTLDAQQVSAYYMTRIDILILGTYDPHNWYFDWAIGGDDQHAHLAHVNAITDRLRQQHERWLR